MNFQKLRTIEKADKYLDMAFGRAGKETDQHRKKTRMGKFPGAKVKRARELELKRITIVKDVLDSQFAGIIDSYPRIDELDDFYKELIKCTLDHGELRKSLGAVNWARSKIIAVYGMYSRKIKNIYTPELMNSARREFYGRVSSVVHQIDKNLVFINKCRKIMQNYPSIKTNMYTVAIAGFPNVGKSTLLTKITTAKPEINSYAFTTKSLMLGYIREKGQSKKEGIQVIDTPGTLDRFEKMNNIERQAYLAIKHLADMVVFVFDLTDEYPMDQQEKLHENLKKFRKPMIIYLSKTDIIERETIDNFTKRHKDTITKPSEIKEKIAEFAEKSPKKTPETSEEEKENI